MTRIKFMKHPLVAGLVFLALAVGALAPARDQPTKDPKRSSAPALTPEQRQRNLESFEHVWQTVRDKHWDPKIGGLDWRAVHDEFRPRMEKADNMAQCREILTAMLQRLGQSHFGIIPHTVYRELDQGTRPPAASPGVPGFDVRVVGDQVLVVAVTEKTSAAKLGVRPGWQVLKIAGADLAPVLAKVRTTARKNPYSLDFQLYRTVLGRLQGQAGDKLNVVFRDGDDKEVARGILLVQPEGVKAQVGNLPAFYIHPISRKLEPNIGYFALNAFFDPENVMKAFEKTVRDNLQADGFIIDIRGNPGGIGLMAVGFGNWFVNQPELTLGTLTLRSGTLQFVLNPRLETFKGPLAILVDGCSVSTSEILAGGLQGLKRATIFGSRTAGAALPSVVECLPNGDGFQYAIADYVSAGGKRLEGAGVKPDVEVPLVRQALLRGRDPVLDAAVQWIADQKKSSK
jgi:carboxyl-terminal processing protease